MKKVLLMFVFTILMIGQSNLTYAGQILSYKDFPDLSVKEDYSGNDVMDSVFYNIDSEFKVYEEPKWLNYPLKDKYLAIGEEALDKGFLDQDQWDQIKEIVDCYEEKLLADLNYRLLKGNIDEKTYKDSVQNFGRTPYLYEFLLNAEGEKIYLCYTEEHLKALIDLSIYNIIEKDDPVLNLRDFAKKSDAVRLLVKVFRLENAALVNNYKHPYEGVPEGLDPYIGIAYKNGWFGKVNEGTIWDEDDISPLILGKIVGIETSYDFENNVFSNDSSPYELDIYKRPGAYKDIFKSRIRLEAGEKVRNGDLISMIRIIMDKNLRENKTSVLRNLLRYDVINYDIINFMDEQNYFLIYENKEPLIENIIYQYGKKFINVGASTKYLYGLSYSTDKNQHREIGKSYFHGEYFGNSAMKSSALSALKDLGVSESKAKNIIDKEMKNGVQVRENSIVKLKDNLEVEIGFNEGYYSGNERKRVDQFIYFIYMYQE